MRATDLLQSIQNTPAGLTLAELLALHPGVARRTAQRWLGQAAAGGRHRGVGRGAGAALFVWCGPASGDASQSAC